LERAVILLLLALFLASTLLVVPGYLLAARRRSPDDVALGLPSIALGTWLALAVFGVGHQSLTHALEAFGVSAFAIVAAYGKIAVGPRLSHTSSGLLFSAAVMAVAVGARVLTPYFPE
jgi:hypothetical protein